MVYKAVMHEMFFSFDVPQTSGFKGFKVPLKMRYLSILRLDDPVLLKVYLLN